MTNHEMLDSLEQDGPLGAKHSFAEFKDSSVVDVRTHSLVDFNHFTTLEVPRSEAILEGASPHISLNGDRGSSMEGETPNLACGHLPTVAGVAHPEAILSGASTHNSNDGDVHSHAEGAMCRDDHVCATFDLLEDQLCEVPILEVADLDVFRLPTSSSTAVVQGIKLKSSRGRPRKKTLQKNKVSEPACSMNNEFLSSVQNPESVANKVWEIGCTLGLSGYHDEFEAVNQLVEMEKRDRGGVGQVGNR
ncbi:LysR family transcriptional regulator [Sesbania bispinosa]|nr:LysR family transcriptional regulator [Sesbania bispinosa]